MFHTLRGDNDAKWLFRFWVRAPQYKGADGAREIRTGFDVGVAL
jgi:hypothetical protein